MQGTVDVDMQNQKCCFGMEYYRPGYLGEIVCLKVYQCPVVEIANPKCQLHETGSFYTVQPCPWTNNQAHIQHRVP